MGLKLEPDIEEFYECARLKSDQNGIEITSTIAATKKATTVKIRPKWD